MEDDFKDLRVKVKKFIPIVIVLSLIAILAGCASAPKPTPEEIASADYGPEPSNCEQAIKNIVAPKLIDPYSAVYNFSTPKKGRNNMSGGIIYGWHVCGTINSKNRMGGYVGPKPFYAMIYNDKVVRFIFQGIMIPDSFKMGILSGLTDTARSTFDDFCKD